MCGLSGQCSHLSPACVAFCGGLRYAVSFTALSSSEKALANELNGADIGNMTAKVDRNFSFSGRTAKKEFAKGLAAHRDASPIPVPAATRPETIEEVGVSTTMRGVTPAAVSASSIWYRT